MKVICQIPKNRHHFHYPRQAVSSHDWCWVSSVRCMRKVDALESNIGLSETKIAQNLLERNRRNIIFQVRIAIEGSLLQMQTPK